MVNVLSKLTILAHGDSDGVASAAFAKAALKAKYDEINVYFTHPTGLYNDFKELADGDVIIVDIALNESHVRDLIMLFNKYKGKIIYIDHHPALLEINLNSLNIEILKDQEGASSELTYKYFKSYLSRDFDRVALYGCIGDYADENNWVKRTLRRWDKRQIYFEAGF